MPTDAEMAKLYRNLLLLVASVFRATLLAHPRCINLVEILVKISISLLLPIATQIKTVMTYADRLVVQTSSH